MSTIPRRLWRIAGALALVHVILIPISLALEMPALFADGTKGIQESYVEGSMARAFTGGVLESVGFMLLIPVLVFLGRALGRTTEGGRWAAQTAVLCGLGYVAVTFAVGFPAGAASMHGAQNGLDLQTALAINNVRIFGYFLSLLLLGGCTIGFAMAARADGLHRRWIGGFGLVTGVVLLVSTPLAALNLHDWGTLVWLVWFVGVAILMLRHREPAEEAPRSAAEQVRIGHS